MQTYTPYHTLENALRWWPLIVIGMLIGTAAAWGFSRTVQPLYEARAEITINIDLTRTGILTQAETDLAINAAGSIIDSADLRARLLAQAQARGIVLSPEQYAKSVFLERKAESYALRVLLPDPAQAAWLTETWSQLALTDLQTAAEHALAAEGLQNSIDGLTTCLQQAADTTNSAACPDLPAIQAALQQTGDALAAERQAARALFPGLRFSLNRGAQLLPEAVNYNRKWMLLAGALLGLLAGVAAIGLRLPERLSRSSRRA